MKETESQKVLGNLHLSTIEELLRDMKYGSVTLIVQDGKVVQIDKTEKYRIKD